MCALTNALASANPELPVEDALLDDVELLDALGELLELGVLAELPQAATARASDTATAAAAGTDDLNLNVLTDVPLSTTALI
ncbi:hypothetical protein [Conexibacter sp. DBS9H8]|uniref:hypothetical protein n=1 Tax=Conexibacter sp. DBS9H8 TaxID=2937801 RepID=UPI00200CE9D3|nr:hypothetical protein [Conexibacter sp. DBS9H8]